MLVLSLPPHFDVIVYYIFNCCFLYIGGTRMWPRPGGKNNNVSESSKTVDSKSCRRAGRCHAGGVADVCLRHENSERCTTGTVQLMGSECGTSVRYLAVCLKLRTDGFGRSTLISAGKPTSGGHPCVRHAGYAIRIRSLTRPRAGLNLKDTGREHFG